MYVNATGLAIHRGRHDDNDDRPGIPPQWLLDLIADRKMTGGFSTRPSNLCHGCCQYRSVSGACGCH
jgi:hypothetical protein